MKTIKLKGKYTESNLPEHDVKSHSPESTLETIYSKTVDKPSPDYEAPEPSSVRQFPRRKPGDVSTSSPPPRDTYKQTFDPSSLETDSAGTKLSGTEILAKLKEKTKQKKPSLSKQSSEDSEKDREAKASFRAQCAQKYGKKDFLSEGRKRLPPMLYTFPGSGNTWSRCYSTPV